MRIVDKLKPDQEMKDPKFIFGHEQNMEGACRGILFYVDIEGGPATVTVLSRANNKAKYLPVEKFTESGVYNIPFPLFDFIVKVDSTNKETEVTIDAISYN